jgi:hypothetical protein
MNFRYKLFFLTGILILLYSCGDKRCLYVTGQITDARTKKGIANAEVYVLAWYKNMPFDESVFELHVLANEYGYFTAYFPKGHEIDAAAIAQGYKPGTVFICKKQKNYWNTNIELVKMDSVLSEKNSGVRDSTLRDFIFRDKRYSQNK